MLDVGKHAFHQRLAILAEECWPVNEVLYPVLVQLGKALQVRVLTLDRGDLAAGTAEPNESSDSHETDQEVFGVRRVAILMTAWVAGSICATAARAELRWDLAYSDTSQRLCLSGVSAADRGRLLAPSVLFDDKKVTRILWSPKGDVLFSQALEREKESTLSSEYEVALWRYDVATKKAKKLHGDLQEILAVSPDGERVLVRVHKSFKYLTIDATNGRTKGVFSTLYAVAADFMPDSKYVVLCLRDSSTGTNSVVIMDPDKQEKDEVVNRPFESKRDVILSLVGPWQGGYVCREKADTGERYFLAQTTGTARNLPEAEVEERLPDYRRYLPKAAQDSATSLSASPDRRLLAYVDGTDSIYLHPLVDVGEKAALVGHGTCPTFRPDPSVRPAPLASLGKRPGPSGQGTGSSAKAGKQWGHERSGISSALPDGWELIEPPRILNDWPDVWKVARPKDAKGLLPAVVIQTREIARGDTDRDLAGDLRKSLDRSIKTYRADPTKALDRKPQGVLSAHQFTFTGEVGKRDIEGRSVVFKTNKWFVALTALTPRGQMDNYTRDFVDMVEGLKFAGR